MTLTEIFAWIVIVITAIKILTILINPAKWVKVVQAVWKNPRIVMPVSLILAALILYNLLKEISIVQIFAVMLFIILMSAASMSVYSKEILALAKNVLKDKKVIEKSWLPILIWIILILWVLISLL